MGKGREKRSNVRETIKKLTAEAKARLKCADMIVNTLAKVLPG